MNWRDTINALDLPPLVDEREAVIDALMEQNKRLREQVAWQQAVIRDLQRVAALVWWRRLLLRAIGWRP